MKLVTSKTMKTGTNFEGNKAGCICSGSGQWQILIMQDQHIVLGIAEIVE